MPEKSSLLKNPWFWVSGCSILFIVVALISVSLFFIIRANTGGNETDTYQTKLRRIWSDIETASTDLIDESEKVEDTSTLSSFMSETEDYEESIEAAQEDIDSLDAPEEYNQAHGALENAVEDTLEYAQELNTMVKTDAATVDTENLKKVGNAGAKARKSEQEAVEQIDFLTKLPKEVYEIRLDLQTTYESIWNKETQSQKKAKEVEANKALKQNKTIAKSVIDSFMAALLKYDPDTMSAYLSGEALKEFNPEVELSGDSGPDSYVIASSDITPLKNYRYYVNITYKDVYGAKSRDQYKFIVGKVGTEFKIIRRQWLKTL